jgi:hypothetical protein
MIVAMDTFIVERYLPGSSREDLAAIAERLARTDFEPGVHYRGSIIVPGDEACLCVFAADDADRLRAANVALGLPVARIVVAALVEGRREPSQH